MPRSPAHQNRSGAVSGQSKPWRRTLTPLAHSAKAHPSQSLLSERRPDTAEPTKTAAERCQVGASLGGEHPNPLAHSAKAHPSQSLLSERRPDTAEPRLFCESLAFTIFPELTLCALVPTVVFIYHS